MKKVGIIILVAFALMGGCKTKEKTPKPNEEAVSVDTLAVQDSTAIIVEIPTGNDVGQEECRNRWHFLFRILGVVVSYHLHYF